MVAGKKRDGTEASIIARWSKRRTQKKGGEKRDSKPRVSKKAGKNKNGFINVAETTSENTALAGREKKDISRERRKSLSPSWVLFASQKIQHVR